MGFGEAWRGTAGEVSHGALSYGLIRYDWVWQLR